MEYAITARCQAPLEHAPLSATATALPGSEWPSNGAEQFVPKGPVCGFAKATTLVMSVKISSGMPVSAPIPAIALLR